MAQCAFIKPGGDRCGSIAMKGYSTCYGHRPDLARERSRNASKGGKRGGRGRASELSEAKREIRAAIGGVLSGRIERGVGAVLFQGYNTLLKAVEVERKVREQEELEERLAALEQAQEQGGGGYGAAR